MVELLTNRLITSRHGGKHILIMQFELKYMEETIGHYFDRIFSNLVVDKYYSLKT